MPIPCKPTLVRIGSVRKLMPRFHLCGDLLKAIHGVADFQSVKCVTAVKSRFRNVSPQPGDILW
jgi:hypothetical protein